MSFEQTKQIILDIDILSHSDILRDKMLKSLNLQGLYKYDGSCKIYMFDQSLKTVNCSQILIFLNVLACYTIHPDTHQWYRINTHGIMEHYDVALLTINQSIW